MFTRSESAVAGDGGSASAVYVEAAATGWHILKVEGYSRFKGIGVGQRVKSGAFTVGGHIWSITFFPDGYNADTADWICVDLYLDQIPADRDVRARFNLSLLDRAGEPVQAYTGSCAMATFSSRVTSHGRGYPKFIKREDLESSFLDDDSFKIRCDVTVLQETRTRTIPVDPPPLVPPLPPTTETDLQRHLGDLLGSKEGGDVTFEVNGELVTAHRCILAARSPVFKAELLGPMKEKQAGHVLRIEDMEARVFRFMLRFIYTDSLPENEIEEGDKVVIAQHLLVAADRYNIQRLKSMCEETLRSSVDVGTAATTLVLAEQHDCQGLKAACFEFLMRPGNLKAVMASDGFQHLKSSCPSLLEELLATVASGAGNYHNPPDPPRKKVFVAFEELLKWLCG